MWKTLLSEIEKIEAKYGDKPNEPATDQQISLLIKTVKEKFNHDLPGQYLSFLKTVNGLEFNGFRFYGVDHSLMGNGNDNSIDGYIDSNEIWYENEYQKQYMFFGDSDISWYCFDRFNGVYVVLDKPSGTPMHTYSDFDVLLEQALKDSLQ